MTELTCIVCPKGCCLNVDEEDGPLVTGYGCSRGEEYERKELTTLTRTLTSIARTEGAIHPCYPVKTSGEIPKRLITQAMNLLKKVRLSALVAAGVAVVRGICGTGMNWITIKNTQTVKVPSSPEALEPDGSGASVTLIAVRPPEVGVMRDGVPDYTLNRNSTISPSFVTYSLPSERTGPLFLATFMEPQVIRSSKLVTSAWAKPRSELIWILPAA